MKLKLLYISLIILCCAPVFSQEDTIRPVRKFLVPPSSVGYTWQGTHNFDFGVQPMLLLNAKNYHNNLALVITANYAIINGSGYLTPRTKLKLYKEFRSRKLAWIVSVGHSYTSIHSEFDHRITPEAGISYSWFHLTYGYNFRISGYSDNVTNANRISLRIGVW